MDKDDVLPENWKNLELWEAYTLLQQHFTLRSNLLHILYPYPPKCKNCAWIVGILIITGMTIVIVMFGLLFDLKSQSIVYEEYEADYLETCDNNKSYSEKLDYEY
eukprot:UN23457